MKVHDYVEALEDGPRFKKGTIGTVDNMWRGAAGPYIGVNVNGIYIGPSLEKCWKVVPASRRRINF